MKLGFGERIRKEMKLQGYSEPLISKSLGVKLTTYNNWMNERSQPSYENLISVCAFLQLNLNWALTGKGPIDPPHADAKNSMILDRDDFRAARRDENARKAAKDSINQRARKLQKEVENFNATSSPEDHIHLEAGN